MRQESFMSVLQASLVPGHTPEPINAPESKPVRFRHTKLIDARNATGMTQRQLADVVKCSNATIVNAEKGQSILPAIASRIERAIGVRPNASASREWGPGQIQEEECLDEYVVSDNAVTSMNAAIHAALLSADQQRMAELNDQIRRGLGDLE